MGDNGFNDLFDGLSQQDSVQPSWPCKYPDDHPGYAFVEPGFKSSLDSEETPPTSKQTSCPTTTPESEKPIPEDKSGFKHILDDNQVARSVYDHVNAWTEAHLADILALIEKLPPPQQARLPQCETIYIDLSDVSSRADPEDSGERRDLQDVPVPAPNRRKRKTSSTPSGEPLKKKNRRVCRVEGCGKQARDANTCCCSTHGGGRRCNFPGCAKGAANNGMFCTKHYQ